LQANQAFKDCNSTSDIFNNATRHSAIFFMQNTAFCHAKDDWTNFTASQEPAHSPFRITVISTAAALLAVTTFIFLLPLCSVYAYLITYDAGLNPQMVQLLVLTHNILAQDTMTQVNTKESAIDLDLMKQINQGRQMTSTALAQLNTLQDFGKLLEDNPTGSMTSAVQKFANSSGTVNTQSPEFANFINYNPPAQNLTFNGSNFQGGNFGFSDNLANFGGLPVSADREPPLMLIPLSDSANAIMTGAVSAGSANPAMQQVAAGFNALYPSGQPVAQRMIADGVVVRQAQPFDNLYIAKVQEGSAQSKMEFWGLQDGLATKGLAYHPFTGIRTIRDAAQTRFDPTNTLSAGAYAAVEHYNQTARATGATQVKNSYANYAYYVTPALIATTRIQPGQRIEITPEVVAAAKRIGPRYDTNVPNRIAQAAEIDTLVPHRLALRTNGLMPVQNATGSPTQGQTFQGISVNPSNVPPSYQGQGVAVVGLSLPQTENYLNQIFSNDQRLGINQTITGITSTMMDYINKIQQGLVMVRQALQLLRQASSYFNALEGVTQALNVIDQTLAKVQKDIHDYTAKIFDYLGGKQIIISDRNNIVQTAQNTLATVAQDKLAVAMQAQYWGNLGK
jgi:hypothetical protein